MNFCKENETSMVAALRTKAINAMAVALAGALLMIVLGACSKSAKSNEDGTLFGTVSTNGSTSMERVVGCLAEVFMSENPDVTITYDATGSGTGIECASNGTCDIGLASRKLACVIRSAVELLAGIPSVVYRLVGMIVLVPAVQSAFALSSGATLLTASIVLSVMILPYIINVTSTALDAVPKEYEEGSLALGATETETYFRVSLHAARSGVAVAIIQGVGRALGEAMAIIMVSGNVANMPHPLGSVRFLTTAIVSEMSYAPYGSLHRNALFSIALVLFVFIVLVNVVLSLVVRPKEA